MSTTLWSEALAASAVSISEVSPTPDDTPDGSDQLGGAPWVVPPASYERMIQQFSETYRAMFAAGTAAMSQMGNTMVSTMRALYEVGNGVTFDWVLQRGAVRRATFPQVTTAEARSRALEVLLALESGDPTEQRETWDHLVQALDENRLSSRPLFPDHDTRS